MHGHCLVTSMVDVKGTCKARAKTWIRAMGAHIAVVGCVCSLSWLARLTLICTRGTSELAWGVALALASLGIEGGEQARRETGPDWRKLIRRVFYYNADFFCSLHGSFKQQTRGPTSGIGIDTRTIALEWAQNTMVRLACFVWSLVAQN